MNSLIRANTLNSIAVITRALNELDQVLQLLTKDTKNNNIITQLKHIIKLINNAKENNDDINIKLSTIVDNVDNMSTCIKKINDDNKNKTYGRIDFENGYYIGELKNGIRNGEGEMTFKNGDIYSGYYKNGKRNGKGKFYYKSGEYKGDIYEGDYKNGECEGKGIYYFNRDDEHKGDRYEGNFKNEKSNGKGIYYFHCGDRYEGDFKDWKRDGKGVWYYKNGDREMGDYKDDKKVGIHVYLYENGRVETIKY